MVGWAMPTRILDSKFAAGLNIRGCFVVHEKNRDRHQLNSDGDKIIGDCP